jgi:ABC-2 type transport system permease protein
VASALMLGSLGLLLSVHIKQLENFAGTMNFVIFPMYFMSTALYPLWKLEESGAAWVYHIARINPFTHAVEWMRFALYDKDPGVSPYIVLGTLLVCFGLAAWGYDPQRGFGALTKRGS